MSTEKSNAAAAISDEQLDQVTGGYAIHGDTAADKYYAWEGSDTDDSKYLCPNCKRPVHHGSWFRYYCDPCNASWFDEDKLLPNLNCGKWKRITKEEYNARVHGCDR